MRLFSRVKFPQPFQSRGRGFDPLRPIIQSSASEFLTEVQRATARLYGQNGLGATNVKLSTGTVPATPEVLARELNTSLDRIEHGDFEVVDTSCE